MKYHHPEDGAVSNPITHLSSEFGVRKTQVLVPTLPLGWQWAKYVTSLSVQCRSTAGLKWLQWGLETVETI